MVEGLEAEVCIIMPCVCVEGLFRSCSPCQVVVDAVEVGVVGEEEEGCSPTFYQAMVTGSVLIQGKNWYPCVHTCSVRW